jgi:hypothetical protein
MATQPYFFYSNKCSNCSQVVETLKALNKAGLYKFILVESLPRNQIPSFLKKVPTMYLPETKEVIVGKSEIFAHIAKPTNARKELPNKEAVPTGGSSQQIMGDISAWGFEGTTSLTEHYSDWNAPASFTGGGGSMYTFLNDSGPVPSNPVPGIPSGGGVESENTLKSKTGSNDDVSARMAAMEEQRKKEFGGVSRK